MFLVESKLRNLIRSVIVESLLKEEEDVKEEEAINIEADEGLKNIVKIIEKCRVYPDVFPKWTIDDNLMILHKCKSYNDFKELIKKPDFLHEKSKNTPLEIIMTNWKSLSKIFDQLKPLKDEVIMEIVNKLMKTKYKRGAVKRTADKINHINPKLQFDMNTNDIEYLKSNEKNKG